MFDVVMLNGEVDFDCRLTFHIKGSVNAELLSFWRLMSDGRGIDLWGSRATWL